MLSSPPDLAQVRLDNALRLLEEFVRATARHADAATLRGLERRFAERLQIQPSYWSQIKSRSRQIGERLARQFEQLCHKPVGWMDLPHDSAPGVPGTHSPGHGAAAGVSGAPAARGTTPGASSAGEADLPDERLPLDDDEHFIVGLVLTYYRRHPQRARTRLLDLLGEALIPGSASAGPASTRPATPAAPGARPAGSSAAATAAANAGEVEDARALWQRVQAGVAPLRKKR